MTSVRNTLARLIDTISPEFYKCVAMDTIWHARKLEFMELAMEQARIALDCGEVPVGCVFIDSRGNMIAKGHNRTVEDENVRLCHNCNSANSEFRPHITVS